MSTSPASLARLARASGTFAMVAADQRDTLRSIVRDRTGRLPDDAELSGAKVAIARRLSPDASGLLLDREYGLGPVVGAHALDPRCGLIVAADRLTQEPGGPVLNTDVDDELNVDAAVKMGAVALKLLVVWWGGSNRLRVEDVVDRFLALCRRGHVLSVVEAVVRPPLTRSDPSVGPGARSRTDASFDADAERLEAARVLAAHGPDLYKGEVPFLGQAPAAAIAHAAKAVTDAIACPWVVLSNGVPLGDFPAAMEAACRGGASGFLAGRALWSDALVAGEDLDARLASVSVPRLRSLAAVADRLARPWQAVVA